MTDRDFGFLPKYRLSSLRKVLFILVCIVIALAVVVLNIAVGLYNMSFVECFQVLWDHITGVIPETFEEYRRDALIWDQRLPRAIGAFAIGSILGVCGAAMQNTLKNPLADPYTMGISSGASLGVSLVVILGISFLPSSAQDFNIVIGAFLFSLIPTGIILAASGLKRLTPTAMILTGVAVMYLFGGVNTMLRLIADPEDLTAVYQWDLGNLGNIGWDNLPFVVVAMVVSLVCMMFLNGHLNILGMDDESVRSLGINPRKTRLTVMVIVSLCTAVAVCFTGTIGFVGLVAPHIVRIFIGSNNRFLIPASAAFGGLFLLMADTVAKVAGSTDLPVGIITSLVGGPLFLYILIRQRKSQWQ